MPWKAKLIKVTAVAGVLQKQGKLLLAERPVGKPYSGYWEFPGGKIEENESGEQALIRELNEELGVDILSPQFLFTHHYTYPDKHVELQVWLITQFQPQPYGKENQELRWVSLTEMKNLNLLQGNWLILEKLANSLANAQAATR